jgi:hypothetical protein
VEWQADQDMLTHAIASPDLPSFNATIAPGASYLYSTANVTLGCYNVTNPGYPSGSVSLLCVLQPPARGSSLLIGLCLVFNF